MRLPTWEELSSVEEQLEVLEYPLDQSLFVVGPPGSGKTVLAIQRAQMAASESASSFVALVTYNRMLRRLLELMMGKNRKIDIDTMHRFIRRDYKIRTGSEPPQEANDRFNYDWNAIQTSLKGHKNAGISKSHLVVDEGQDLPQGFFRYASQRVSHVVTVFADEDQALNVEHTTLEKIKVATGLDDPKILSKNHRNTKEIGRLAEHFHSGGLPVAKVLRSSSGEIPRLIRRQNHKDTADLVSNWFKNRGGCVGIIVNRNNIGSIIYEELCKNLSKEQVNFYTSDQRNEGSINVLKPGVTVLNKESTKGQEFDAVYILELESFIPCNTDTERRAMYMMCTRARDNLFLVYDNKTLSAQAEAALPGSDILDRT